MDKKFQKFKTFFFLINVCTCQHVLKGKKACINVGVFVKNAVGSIK